MGISGLLPFLEKISKKCHLNEFQGSVVAIDAYCWLHKGAFACAEKLVRGEETSAHIKYCLKYLSMLQSFHITPILVFDGQHLEAKKETELKRREDRKFARQRASELFILGKTEEARQFFKRCVDITHDMALTLIKECRSMNVDCIVAPYEADAQLAFLNLRGFADFIITEDSDLLLFGCKKILFKLNIDGYGTLIEQEKLSTAMQMSPDIYSFDKFRYMCILSGCDYLKSLPGIGIKKAHKAFRFTHNNDIDLILSRLDRYVNMSNLNVPDEYIKKFKIADATFKHQIIFNPVSRKLEYLTDPATSGTDEQYLCNAGIFIDNDLAFQIALGNVDPFSKKVLDTWNPDTVGCSEYSIWSKFYKKKENKLNKPKQPTYPCFKNKTIPLKTKALPVEETENEKLSYDIKLEEELKVYKSPPNKKIKTEQVEEIVQQKIESKQEYSAHNPFIKSKEKKISKFSKTEINKSVVVKSRFFSSRTKSASEISEGRVSPTIGYNISNIDLGKNDKSKSDDEDCFESSFTTIDKCNYLKDYHKDKKDHLLPANTRQQFDQPHPTLQNIQISQFQKSDKGKITSSNKEEKLQPSFAAEEYSDIENLTPSESSNTNIPYTEESKCDTFLDRKSKDEETFTHSFNLTKRTSFEINSKQETKEFGICKDTCSSEDSIHRNESCVETKSTVKKQLTCKPFRRVGLSKVRTIKKAQPTLLTVFQKMESKK